MRGRGRWQGRPTQAEAGAQQPECWGASLLLTESSAGSGGREASGHLRLMKPGTAEPRGVNSVIKQHLSCSLNDETGDGTAVTDVGELTAAHKNATQGHQELRAKGRSACQDQCLGC